ncbi:nucleotidyltransferase family protein [bacterium]|nr:nucleotidyltransferase family protein [bacterium]
MAVHAAPCHLALVHKQAYLLGYSIIIYHGIEIPRQAITDFCRRNHIRRLSLFGSILRDDFTDQSDIDMLVEFEPGHVPGYIGLAGMEIELTKLLGRKVDMRLPEELSRFFCEQVLHEAEYVAP